MNIIGVTGPAGVGKDCFAEYMVMKHRFARIALADPMKRIARDIWDFSNQQLWGPSSERNKPDKRFPREPGRFEFPNGPEGALWVRAGDAFILVDADDYTMVTSSTPWLKKSANVTYAMVSRDGEEVRLHRLIAGAQEGMDVDHINGDGLDNRKANLRVCTHQENMANQPKREGGSSSFKGVCWDESKGKWAAKLTVNGETKNLGRFDSEADAAMAYDREASKCFGAFARLNKDLFLTPREALQRMGTEFGRKCYVNTWVDLCIRDAKKLLENRLTAHSTTYSPELGVVERLGVLTPTIGVVVPDCRFYNEIDAIHQVGGKVIRLRRQTATDALKVGVVNHASEKEQQSIPDGAFDLTIDCADGVLAFYDQLDTIIPAFLAGMRSHS
jgi:hypothetical protein